VIFFIGLRGILLELQTRSAGEISKHYGNTGRDWGRSPGVGDCMTLDQNHRTEKHREEDQSRRSSACYNQENCSTLPRYPSLSPTRAHVLRSTTGIRTLRDHGL